MAQPELDLGKLESVSRPTEVQRELNSGTDTVKTNRYRIKYKPDDIKTNSRINQKLEDQSTKLSKTNAGEKENENISDALPLMPVARSQTKRAVGLFYLPLIEPFWTNKQLGFDTELNKGEYSSER
jgi:hypothetical protein